MSSSTAKVLAGAALLGGAALLAACGGGNEEVIRQQGELRARLEAQTAEVEALRTRVRDLEARDRALEEQIAAVGVGMHPASRPSAAPAPAAAPRGGAEEEAGSDPTPEEVASFLESEAGKEQLREFLKEEDARKEEADRTRRREQMETMIRDRVTGYLTEQLALTPDQQARVIDIATETMDRMTELWRGARGAPGAPPADFQAMREKSEEIRRESMDKLAQALTVDQYNKLEELGPGAGFMMGGRGGFGGGRGGPGGGGPGGGGRGR